jgi:hypothetical protein
MGDSVPFLGGHVARRRRCWAPRSVTAPGGWEVLALARCWAATRRHTNGRFSVLPGVVIAALPKRSGELQTGALFSALPAPSRRRCMGALRLLS